MTEPYLGEVQILGFGFAPVNWAQATGQLIPLRQSTALYALYGTTFGGDGSNNFGLPNMAARTACGTGGSPGNSPRVIGETFGTTNVALTGVQMPMHTHGFSDYQPEGVGKLSGVPSATSGIGTTNGLNIFAPVGQATSLNPAAVSMSGNGIPHENRQPFLGLIYAVAMTGIFPAFN